MGTCVSRGLYLLFSEISRYQWVHEDSLLFTPVIKVVIKPSISPAGTASYTCMEADGLFHLSGAGRPPSSSTLPPPHNNIKPQLTHNDEHEIIKVFVPLFASAGWPSFVEGTIVGNKRKGRLNRNCLRGPDS